jgi:hypothetical protein
VHEFETDVSKPNPMQGPMMCSLRHVAQGTRQASLKLSVLTTATSFKFYVLLQKETQDCLVGSYMDGNIKNKSWTQQTIGARP